MSEKLQIGHVLKQAVALARRKAGLLLVASFALAATAILLQLSRDRVQEAGLLPAALLILISNFLYLPIAALLFTSLIAELQGERQAWRKTVAAAARLIIPMIAISILTSLGIGLASVLLIVPGLIVAVAWAVALPARAAEDVGVLKALTRSADLTRGHRWSIFWLSAVYWAVVLALDVIATPVGLAIAEALNGSAEMVATAKVGIGQLIGAVGSVVSVLGLSVLYIELRTLETGVRDQSIAEVFA